ncbi:MAG TPA: hypothetical protein VG847_08815 [Chitinophagaceae bacterium]|nr:hypothetical protein [Chitinophagaceae bacterium]
MKKIILLYPHFPPSNLAGVHRPRFFAQHLASFGWEPIVLTVNEKYYEEELDYNLVKLLPPGLRIEKVAAFRITKPRLVGDIGLRAFFQLYKKAKQLIQKEKIEFVYISIPSFYCALLGRWLNATTGVKYGIDYIDPWVHRFPGSNKIFSRHWLSTRLAAILEPVAVKKASLITGVAEGYYLPVLERNPALKNKVITGAMPYGGEKKDFDILRELHLQPYLFRKKEGIIQLVYAGAMMPKSYKPLEAIFRAVSRHRGDFKNVEFHFIGTGSRTNDAGSFNIKPLAEKYGLWQTNVYEYPKRIPYLDVLIHLKAAEGIFILGSTEPHYTPSKIYQAVLSEKLILAILHESSSAVKVLKESNCGVLLDFNGETDVEKIEKYFPDVFQQYILRMKNFNAGELKTEIFDQFSAKKITERLVIHLNSNNNNTK